MFPIIKQKVNCAPVQGTGGDRSGSIRKADALLGQASLGPAVSSTQWGDERKAGLSCAISNLTENCMADTKGRGWQILQKQEQLCSFQRAPQARQTSALKEPCFFRAAANACWHVKYRLYLSQVQPTAQLSCSPAGVKEEDQSLLQPKQSALEEEEPYLSHYYLWARTGEQTQTSPYLEWTKTNTMLHFALRCHK